MPASTIRRVVLADWPGPIVTSVGAVSVDRVAAAPTWLTCGEPAARDIPGYPNSVHGAFDRLVK